MLPADGRGSDENATKALTGTNAIVCAAGAGPLPTKAAAVVEAARQNGMNLSLAGSAAVEGLGSTEGDVQVRRADILVSVVCCAAPLQEEPPQPVTDAGIPHFSLSCAYPSR